MNKNENPVNKLLVEKVREELYSQLTTLEWGVKEIIDIVLDTSSWICISDWIETINDFIDKKKISDKRKEKSYRSWWMWRLAMMEWDDDVNLDAPFLEADKKRFLEIIFGEKCK